MDHLAEAKEWMDVARNLTGTEAGGDVMDATQIALSHAVIALVEEIHNVNENVKSINRSMLAGRRI